jgi:hypothetical protein
VQVNGLDSIKELKYFVALPRWLARRGVSSQSPLPGDSRQKDSQIPLHWAERTYSQLIKSPKRELKIFTQREGGVQHSSFDNSANAGAYIADWVAETLGGSVAARRPEG